MIESIYLVVAAFALLETKHLIADFFLQSAYQLTHKGIYGHPGGLLHAAIHACGSSPVFLLIAPSATVIPVLKPVLRHCGIAAFGSAVVQVRSAGRLKGL